MGQDFKILYCGDHDPSGLDMCNYIVRTLRDFRTNIQFKRIGLNMDQIKRLNPPPNQVKESDSRAEAYIAKYGKECWELDTLPPHELNRIVESEIIECIDDMDEFERCREEELEGRDQLRIVGTHFDEAHEWAKTFADEEEEFDDDDDEEEDMDDGFEPENEEEEDDEEIDELVAIA
jgi:hypothetical protein